MKKLLAKYTIHSQQQGAYKTINKNKQTLRERDKEYYWELVVVGGKEYN